MKTYNSFINFLCSLMAIEIPDVYYDYKNQYYDLEGVEIKPFKMDEDIKLNCDEALVKPYKKYICRNYSLSEIKERLDYSGFELGQTQA